MKDSIYDFVLDQLEQTPLTYSQVSEGSGVPQRTLEKIARREIRNPGVQHIETLARYFRKHPSDRLSA